MICKTDLKATIKLLEQSASLIDKHCSKPCELDKARQCKRLAKKFRKKISS